MAQKLVEVLTTYYQSPIGLIEISGNENYISTIAFNDEEKQEDTPSELPDIFIECIDQLIGYFQGNRRQFDFPFHQSGTEFQQKVWHCLLQISFGKTIPYLTLAIQTGDRNNTRAVANANGKNEIAIVVPCHRVIGNSGQLTGYAGGLWRKQWLLEHEKKHFYGILTLF